MINKSTKADLEGIKIDIRDIVAFLMKAKNSLKGEVVVKVTNAILI